MKINYESDKEDFVPKVFIYTKSFLFIVINKRGKSSIENNSRNSETPRTGGMAQSCRPGKRPEAQKHRKVLNTNTGAFPVVNYRL